MKSLSILVTVVLLLSIFPVFVESQAIEPEDITINRTGVLLKGKFYVAKGEGIFPTIILLPGFPGNETDVLGIEVNFLWRELML